MDNSNLSIAEEVMLLLLHDEDGSFVRCPDWSVRYALSGAVLMDLALSFRIDSDLKELVVVDNTPTNDPILDSLLTEIDSTEEKQNIRFWVERTAVHADAVREAALKRLTERGILEERDARFLWVFKARRYPVIDGHAEKEVKLRILEVLFSDKIPDPHDVVLLCLAHACGLLREILSARELESAVDRIEQVRKLDLIGQEVANAISDIEVSLAIASQPQFY